MDQTSCSKTIIPAIIQNDVARDLILLNAYEETCLPVNFMQKEGGYCHGEAWCKRWCCVDSCIAAEEFTDSNELVPRARQESIICQPKQTHKDLHLHIHACTQKQAQRTARTEMYSYIGVNTRCTNVKSRTLWMTAVLRAGSEAITGSAREHIHTYFLHNRMFRDTWKHSGTYPQCPHTLCTISPRFLPRHARTHAHCKQLFSHISLRMGEMW